MSEFLAAPQNIPCCHPKAVHSCPTLIGVMSLMSSARICTAQAGFGAVADPKNSPWAGLRGEHSQGKGRSGK